MLVAFYHQLSLRSLFCNFLLPFCSMQARALYPISTVVLTPKQGPAFFRYWSPFAFLFPSLKGKILPHVIFSHSPAFSILKWNCKSLEWNRCPSQKRWVSMNLFWGVCPCFFRKVFSTQKPALYRVKWKWVLCYLFFLSHAAFDYRKQNVS